jgi:hypothetical protein
MNLFLEGTLLVEKGKIVDKCREWLEGDEEDFE